MQNLAKSFLAIGQVFGLVIGYNFTTPILQTLEKYPYLRYFS